jgi:hypothetical protein
MSKSAQLRLAVLSSMARGPMLDPFTGPNVERMTADPNVCFNDGGDGGDGGAAAAVATGEAKYTDADLSKKISARVNDLNRKFGAEIEGLKAQVGETEALKARLAELEEAAENAGKTATELAQSKSQKEIDKLRREIEDRDKRLNDATARETQARTELRNDRAITKVMGALASEKAVNADKAAKYALTDIAITHHDDGSMTATYGDAEDVSVNDAVKAWLKDNDNFLPAPQGGAGTRPGPAGRGGKPLHEMSDDELIRAANARRASGR